MLVLDESVLDDGFLNSIDLEGHIDEIRKEGIVCLFLSDNGLETSESEAVKALLEKILSITDLDGWICRLFAISYEQFRRWNGVACGYDELTYLARAAHSLGILSDLDCINQEHLTPGEKRNPAGNWTGFCEQLKGGKFGRANEFSHLLSGDIASSDDVPSSFKSPIVSADSDSLCIPEKELQALRAASVEDLRLLFDDFGETETVDRQLVGAIIDEKIRQNSGDKNSELGHRDTDGP